MVISHDPPTADDKAMACFDAYRSGGDWTHPHVQWADLSSFMQNCIKLHMIAVACAAEIYYVDQPDKLAWWTFARRVCWGLEHFGVDCPCTSYKVIERNDEHEVRQCDICESLHVKTLLPLPKRVQLRMIGGPHDGRTFDVTGEPPPTWHLARIKPLTGPVFSEVDQLPLLESPHSESRYHLRSMVTAGVALYEFAGES